MVTTDTDVKVGAPNRKKSGALSRKNERRIAAKRGGSAKRIVAKLLGNGRRTSGKPNANGIKTVGKPRETHAGTVVIETTAILGRTLCFPRFVDVFEDCSREA
jgi:hypothetical protein